MNSSSQRLKPGSDGSAPTPEERRHLDPLGAIENLARTLCREDRFRRSESWEDYWAEAEAWLVKGLGAEGPSGQVSGNLCQSGLSPEFTDLTLASGSKLLSVLARALLRPLNDHEACCLGYILQTHALVWSDETKDAPLTAEMIGEVLAHLSFDYPEELYQQTGETRPAKIPLAERANYWSKRLKAVQTADEPLGYADRNTILRLREQISAQPEISALEFKG